MLSHCEMSKVELEEVLVSLLKHLKEEVYLLNEDFKDVANECGINDEHLEYWALLEDNDEESEED